ncbi:uncharacterized protein CTRU02_202717 [Colletotrichum truncatum]|uniref:Uncharacterized protein n=1 Tax=Colletotrichum truncatum TaxID=5467 RepID=A0ACC3ZL60_COLTU|nr:uncharacterized protein CTRU02_10639 [Colletotrichum truncatum]KAF6786940.1 hypothetical protein CTRU02_10639 [Colletotrichum truncatum]
MDGHASHTLYIWPQGFYPRRVVYYLIIKGLATPAGIFQGKSATASLKLSLIAYNPDTKTLDSIDVDDPKPADKTIPCMRIVDSSKGTTHWIHESTAIPAYLEDAYTELPPLQSSDIVNRAIMGDIILAINAAQDDFSYYLRHASPIACKFSGLDEKDRDYRAALNAKAQMNKGLRKVQNWAAESLRESGWLTPGITTPGLADVCLAGWVRYIWLAYEFDVLEGENLDGLREWWTRFQNLPWWKEMEEIEEVHPKDLRFGRKSLDV